MKSKSLLILCLVGFVSSAFAKTEKYVVEYSDNKNFTEPYYNNRYEGCENIIKKNGDASKTDCFADNPTGRTGALTKEECSAVLEYILKEHTGKYMDNNKNSIVFLLKHTEKKRYARCIAYDFDKLLD